jgi:processing peptidase subunit beta
MQFSKKRLTDFGDLPAGEIPEALKFSKPVFQKTLSNGITAVA